jgi:hypothetical protein
MGGKTKHDVLRIILGRLISINNFNVSKRAPPKGDSTLGTRECKLSFHPFQLVNTLFQ